MRQIKDVECVNCNKTKVTFWFYDWMGVEGGRDSSKGETICTMHEYGKCTMESFLSCPNHSFLLLCTYFFNFVVHYEVI